MKQALMVATVPSMIGQFNVNNIEILQGLGYKVGVACDFTDRSVWDEGQVDKFIRLLDEKKVNYYQIDFSRNPLKVNANIRAYRQLKKVVKEKGINLIHCHTPVAGVISRIIARKTMTKIIYTAHGFHFYDGAPLKNWIFFYPIEKFLSRWTDVLITINREDYIRAVKKLHAKDTVYVPGVGVDIDRIDNHFSDVEKKRNELGLKREDVMILSVGELSARKNQEIVIKTLGAIGDAKFKYYIAGKGDIKERLMQLAQSTGVDNNVFFLGFRTDVIDLCKAADLFVLPSLQEGLPVALMEAIGCKTKAVCSEIRGNKDLVCSRQQMFNPKSVASLKKCVFENINRESDLIEEKNYEKLRENCDLEKISLRMRSIYESNNS